MLAKPPELVTQELLDNIPYPSNFLEILTNIIPVYPVPLSAFKIIKKENGIEVLNFPFNPPVTPIEFVIQQALSEATKQTQDKVAGNMFVSSDQNPFVQSMINIILRNREVIEGETGIRLETLFDTKVERVTKQKKESSLLIADAQGNVEGDVLEIVMDI